jgi:S-adenosylmethionine hydrolase
MSDPIVTLTTDFGDSSPYVAAMKGVILGINPHARLVDLSHRIPPQSTAHAAHFLAASIPYFPYRSIHVVVVDPGVGTDRALLLVSLDGQRLLVPDNGCWTELARKTGRTPEVIRLSTQRFWRHPVSATFHGRDILAPVAAHLSLGMELHDFGQPVTHWVRFVSPEPKIGKGRVEGEVVLVDSFGNLITNIPGEAVAALGDGTRVQVGDLDVPGRVRAYDEAKPGALVALTSSFGTLEVAVVRGSAALRLHADAGTPVTAISDAHG